MNTTVRGSVEKYLEGYKDARRNNTPQASTTPGVNTEQFWGAPARRAYCVVAGSVCAVNAVERKPYRSVSVIATIRHMCCDGKVPDAESHH